MNTDIAQLVSIALYTPRPDESVAFFHDLLGMEISHRQGQSVYLRAYEDFYQYTLKITEAAQPGLEEVTWRASSPEALERRGPAVGPTNSAPPMVIHRKCYGISTTSKPRPLWRANCATGPRSGRCAACPFAA